jgi:low temperature requirement protein LtrA
VSQDHSEAEHRVTHLELFFDLVFVFAITQEARRIAPMTGRNPRPAGPAQDTDLTKGHD